jgi:hypothetical protein
MQKFVGQKSTYKSRFFDFFGKKLRKLQKIFAESLEINGKIC